MRRAVIAAAAVGVILALVYLLEARRYPWGVPAQPGPGLYPTLVGILMLVSSLAATLLTLVVLHVMGLRRWWVKIGVALAVGLGSQYVFAVLLGVPLPTGFWSR